MDQVRALAALRAVSGHEEVSLRHHPAKEPALLGIGGAGHRAYITVAMGAHAVLAPGGHLLSDQLIEGLPVDQTILELPAGRIGGFHEDKDAFFLFLADFYKRTDAIGTQVGIDRDKILIKPVERMAADLYPAEMSHGIGFGSGTDVSALDIADDNEALLFTIFHRPVKRLQPGDAELLVHGDLGLYGGHEVTDRVHESPVVEPDGFCSALERLAEFVKCLFFQIIRYVPKHRIEPDHDRGIGTADSFDQFIYHSLVSKKIYSRCATASSG